MSDDKPSLPTDVKTVVAALAVLGVGVGGGTFGITARPSAEVTALVAKVEALETKVAELEAEDGRIRAEATADRDEVRCMICDFMDTRCPGCGR